jgi:hypothetical protein
MHQRPTPHLRIRIARLDRRIDRAQHLPVVVAAVVRTVIRRPAANPLIADHLVGAKIGFIPDLPVIHPQIAAGESLSGRSHECRKVGDGVWTRRAAQLAGDALRPRGRPLNDQCRLNPHCAQAPHIALHIGDRFPAIPAATHRLHQRPQHITGTRPAWIGLHHQRHHAIRRMGAHIEAKRAGGHRYANEREKNKVR